MRNWLNWVGLVSIATGTAMVYGCNATASRSVFGEGGGGSDSSTTSAQGGSGQGGSGQAGDEGFGGGCIFGCGGSGGGSGNVCNSGPDEDSDMDGFTTNTGDCNDCDKNVNPGSVEVIGDTMDPKYVASDENCNNQVDEPREVCDQALAVDSSDAFDAAKAVDICKMSAGPGDWGVVSAQWVMANGAAANNTPNFHLGHGMLAGFGPAIQPRKGGRMLSVSSGAARQPTDPGYMSPSGFSKGYSGGHPQGFPKESPACPGVTTGTPYDPTAVEVVIRVPKNAKGFSFDFNFYTYEWPGFICSQYNDFFVAILAPIPMGLSDGQISFDMQGNPISVNNAFMNVCGCTGGPPCTAGGKSFACPLGTNELNGTGFESHAATSWLTTQAPVEPGTDITIRWGAYDSGDGILDSTALIDNWVWSAAAGKVGTAPAPIDPPK